MKRILLYTATVFLISFCVINTVYDYSITDINGVEMPLAAYSGKNIMITILPSIQNDSNTAILQNLDSLYTLYADSLVLIGIPSYEDGFKDDSLESLTAWYRTVLDSTFIVAQGMNTKKSSPYQSPLFNWLTHANENGHFDDDAMGAGEKFFINKDGVLNGLAVPGSLLNSSAVNEIINE